MNPDPKRIKALGRLESYRAEIENVLNRLESLAFWRPAAALRRECEEVLRLMNDQEEQFERKLVVSIVGPGGSGKSTLFNVLSGKDDVSAIGTDRPTTTQIVAVAGTPQETERLTEYFMPDTIRVHESRGTSPLENVILLDTPDVDSTQQEDHVRQVQKAIELSDILLCIFNTENPKTKDHVDFFAPYIRLFHGSSIIGVLNKCDRLDVHELQGAILPEFEKYVADAWGRPLSSLVCVSARAHLSNPGWDDKAPPRHDFDQFAELAGLVHDTFNRPGYAVDRRLDNVMQLRDFMLEEIDREIEKDRTFWTEAANRMKQVERDAFSQAFSRLKLDATGRVLGINVLLYQKIAQRWVGPVGWMIALWGRILIFGTGIMAIFRFGNPIRQVLGVISSLRHFKDAKAAISETEKNEQVGPAFQAYRVELLKNWPDIAELLSRGRFGGGIRDSKRIMSDTDAAQNALANLWRDALDATIDKSAKNFSHLLLQILFNLPTVVLLAHVAWQTARHYFSADYLTTDFFIHALMTVAVVLLLSFFIFQACLRLGAGSDRLIEKTFKRVGSQADPFQQAFLNPVLEEVDRLRQLSQK